MVANSEPNDTTNPVLAVDIDTLPIRERDRWIAATLRFMRDRGYTITAPGVVPDALVAARLERDALAEIVRRETEVPALLGEIGRLIGVVAPTEPEPMTMPNPYADLIAQAQRGERPCTCGQPWRPDAQHRTNGLCLLRTRPGGAA